VHLLQQTRRPVQSASAKWGGSAPTTFPCSQLCHTLHSNIDWNDQYCVRKNDDMAGRILPIALATVAGVSIGVATFGEEFKEQRRQRLQEEYDRYALYSCRCRSSFTHTFGSEVAAQAALTGQSLTPMASNAIPPPTPQQIPVQNGVKTEEAKTPEADSAPSWSAMLGLWAWKKDSKKVVAPEVRQVSPQSGGHPNAGKS
jgi:hypothetical protein